MDSTHEQGANGHEVKTSQSHGGDLSNDTVERMQGCLLGGAVGDALGAPIEFMSGPHIFAAHGPQGVGDYLPAYGGIGRITDDTQMSLFTADGLLRSAVRAAHRGICSATGVTAHAYQRWLCTQTGERSTSLVHGLDNPGWLYPLPALHAQRAPGLTCLSALKAMKQLGDPAHNDSKGCGGVMRVAPVGLWFATVGEHRDSARCFELATDFAALTHGHPTGQLAAGAFAVLVQWLVSEPHLSTACAPTKAQSLALALNRAKALLTPWPDHGETLQAMEHAQSLAQATDVATPDSVHQQNVAALGAGWVAEEALAIAIYCAWVARDFEHGVRLSINHSGDSDSTGSMTGNLLGCIHGIRGIPARWLEPLELRDTIALVALDLACYGAAQQRSGSCASLESEELWRKYPGG